MVSFKESESGIQRYWWFRNDDSQYILISVGKDQTGKTVRELEIQYTDLSKPECPARYPKNRRHVLDITGRGWGVRALELLKRHTPETVWEIHYGGDTLESCTSTTIFPGSNTKGVIQAALKYHNQVWSQKAGGWTCHTPSTL